MGLDLQRWLRHKRDHVPPPPHPAQCSWPKGMHLFQTKRPGFWSETWCRKGATSCLRVYRCLNRFFGWLWSPGNRVWWEWRHFPGPISQPKTPAPNQNMYSPTFRLFHSSAIVVCETGVWSLVIQPSLSCHWRWKERSVTTCISKTSSDLQDSIKYICEKCPRSQSKKNARLEISAIHQSRSERMVSNLESKNFSSHKIHP